MGEGMMDKAKDAADKVADKAGEATNSVTDKIPGDTDDKVVEEGKSLLDKAKDVLPGN